MVSTAGASRLTAEYRPPVGQWPTVNIIVVETAAAADVEAVDWLLWRRYGPEVPQVPTAHMMSQLALSTLVPGPTAYSQTAWQSLATDSL